MSSNSTAATTKRAGACGWSTRAPPGAGLGHLACAARGTTACWRQRAVNSHPHLSRNWGADYVSPGKTKYASRYRARKHVPGRHTAVSRPQSHHREGHSEACRLVSLRLTRTSKCYCQLLHKPCSHFRSSDACLKSPRPPYSELPGSRKRKPPRVAHAEPSTSGHAEPPGGKCSGFFVSRVARCRSVASHSHVFDASRQ